MTPALRTRAVQDTICAVVLYFAAVATYTVPIGPNWLYLVPMAACTWNMVDLARVAAVAVRRS